MNTGSSSGAACAKDPCPDPDPIPLGGLVFNYAVCSSHGPLNRSMPGRFLVKLPACQLAKAM